MITRCESQQRMVTVPTAEGRLRTQPVGLDFGAVMMVAAASGAAGPLLAEVLPEVEAAIVFPIEDSGFEED